MVSGPSPALSPRLAGPGVTDVQWATAATVPNAGGGQTLATPSRRSRMTSELANVVKPSATMVLVGSWPSLSLEAAISSRTRAARASKYRARLEAPWSVNAKAAALPKRILATT